LPLLPHAASTRATDATTGTAFTTRELILKVGVSFESSVGSNWKHVENHAEE
jgi:hypothetical protein